MVRDERRLEAAYRAAVTRHRVLRREVGPLIAHHQAHLKMLGAAPDQSSQRDRSRSARDAVAALRQLEIDATSSLRRHALAARSGDLARVIASMAASSAQHGDVLGAVVAAPRSRP